MRSHVWALDSTLVLGGQTPQVLGAPRLVNTPRGRAMAFDGRQDGLVIPAHPLAGAAQFSVELVFCPAPGGEREQRVVHLQEHGTENRALLETRVADARHWFVDTFMRSGEASQTLYASGFPHSFGPWYHVALVFDGEEMRHYVDGVLEMTGSLAFAPLGAGPVSLGVRLNRVSWFCGTLRAVAFTPRCLAPASFQLWPD